MSNQTDKTLAQIRTELLTTFSAANWVSHSHLVGWLRDTDASHALKARTSCHTPTAVSTPPSSCAATNPGAKVNLARRRRRHTIKEIRGSRLAERRVELAAGRPFQTERCQAWRVSPPLASA
jgi:hypothetical protein